MRKMKTSLRIGSILLALMLVLSWIPVVSHGADADGSVDQSCEHDYYLSTCTLCGDACAHAQHDFYGVCADCGYHIGHTYVDGTCTACGTDCLHLYSGGVCRICDYSCPHHTRADWDGNECRTCDMYCDHEWEDRVCKNCGTVCTDHDFPRKNQAVLWMWDPVCEFCGYYCEHVFDRETLKCIYCDMYCDHSSNTGDTCDLCGRVCTHDWSQGSCPECRPA